MLSKIRPRCSPHVPAIEQSLITEVDEKPYCSPSLWSDDMDIETI